MPYRLAILLLALGSCFAAGPAIAETPAAADAETVGIERFNQVDTQFFRGSQPGAAGFAWLRSQGIRTVVNLRNNETEREIVERLGMKYVGIPIDMQPFGLSGEIPKESVERFFQALDAADSGPVFLHCRRGADRTGTLVALYRITRQGWTVQEAYAEARDIGMRWWHFPARDLLEKYAAAGSGAAAEAIATAAQ